MQNSNELKETSTSDAKNNINNQINLIYLILD